MNKSLERRKIIVGLGNPGDKFRNTRHNTGFMYIDYLLKRKMQKDGIEGKKLKNAIIYKIDEDVVLIKPQTLMNNSGSAVKEVIKWLDVDIEHELILVHDDLDIPLGKFKFQFAKSPKDHKGVKSVEDHLGTTHFNRLRIGVDNRGTRNIPGEKYVLEDFTEEELVDIKKVLDHIDMSESFTF